MSATASPTANVIRFPISQTRQSAERRPVDLKTARRGDAGIWLDAAAAVEVERQLEDYQRLIARARDKSAIAAAIASRGWSAPACADAAEAVGEQLLAHLVEPS